MKNVDKGSLYANALQVYYITMFEPLQEKLFKVSITMIRNDRQNKVIERSKIKDLIKIFEEIDLKKAELIKRGDELVWVGDQQLKIANEYVTKYLIPEVNINN